MEPQNLQGLCSQQRGDDEGGFWHSSSRSESRSDEFLDNVAAVCHQLCLMIKCQSNYFHSDYHTSLYNFVLSGFMLLSNFEHWSNLLEVVQNVIKKCIHDIKASKKSPTLSCTPGAQIRVAPWLWGVVNAFTCKMLRKRVRAEAIQEITCDVKTASREF